MGRSDMIWSGHLVSRQINIMRKVLETQRACIGSTTGGKNGVSRDKWWVRVASRASVSGTRNSDGGQ